MKIPQFKPGKLNQWKYIKKKETIFWIAGFKTENKLEEVLECIKNVKKIDKSLCKKIISYLGENFGIIIISSEWTFACVDYTRSYPIYWYYNETLESLNFSSQANLFKNKNIDNTQLTAFRMSGYTIGSGTLWKEIKSLNAGEFLFYKKKNDFYRKSYFSYIPKESFTYSYTEYKIQLKRQINILIKKIIRDANKRTIIVPLSTGLDSRLIASGLKHYNYKKVKCFSYGIKNNFEAKTSKLIAKQLGYKWIFVDITHKKASSFYRTKKYKNYIENSIDGCATSTIQGLFAINFLTENKYIKKNDIIINGNSGDFISGGHIPIKLPKYKIKDLKKNMNHIMKYHYDKHYLLWENLDTKKNKAIIKRGLFNQIKQNIQNKNLSMFSILELLEFQNRQTKYVINAQRIYDFYNISWLLPLWNKSFIKFWEKVPMSYKLNQKLYKDALKELNFGNVWTKSFNTSYYLSPRWLHYFRLILKVFFLFLGKKEWRVFEKKYLFYWSENIYGYSSLNYFKFARNANVARNYVSIYTLVAEKNNLGKDWQNK